MPEVTTQELKAIFSGDTSSYERAVKKLKGANSELLESDNKVKNQLQGLARELSAAETPADALGAAVDRLSETFQVGLGTGIAALYIKHFAEDFKRARAESDALSDSIERIFAQSNTAKSPGSELAANFEAANSEVDKLLKAANDLENKFSANGFMDSLGSMANIAISPGDFGRALGGEVEQRRAEADEARKAATEAEEALASKERERTGILKTIRTEGEGAGKAKQMELRFAEELFSVERRYGTAMANAVRERQAEERAAFDLQTRHAREEVDLATRVVAIKRDGDQAEVRAANEKLKLARQRLKEAAPGDDTARANLEYQAAKAGLEAAQDQYRVTQSQSILQARIAQLRGSEDEKRMEAIEMERQFLEWKKANTASPDTMRDLEADIERNRAQKAAAEDAIRMRDVASQGLEIDKGFGPTAELQALKAKAQIAWELVDAATQKNNFDQMEYRQLVASAKEADNQLKAKEAENRITEIGNNLESEKLTIQGSTKSEADKRYQITKAQIEATKAEIAALQSLNGELAKAAQLKLQGLENDQRQQQETDFGDSALERNNRLRDQRREERDNQRRRNEFNQNEGLKNVHRDINGNVIEGTNPSTGEKETRQHPSNLDPQLGPDRREFDKANRDEEFRKQFDRKTGQDAADANAKAQEGAQKGADKEKEGAGGNKEIITKLDEVKQAIIDAMLK